MDPKKERIDRVIAESERLRRVIESAAEDLKSYSRELLEAARILSAEADTDTSLDPGGDDGEGT